MARNLKEFQMEDVNRGKVNFRVINRILPEDLIIHLVERELYKTMGGSDPGDDINSEFIDFLVLERFQKSGAV